MIIDCNLFFNLVQNFVFPAKRLVIKFVYIFKLGFYTFLLQNIHEPSPIKRLNICKTIKVNKVGTYT